MENDNVTTFLRRGLFEDTNKTFIIVYNCPEMKSESYQLSSEFIDRWKIINDYSNVYLYVRPNIGHDFQGWNSALFLPSSLNSKIIYESKDKYDGPYLHSSFDTFVFINATVAGPYLPLYVKENWIDLFTSRLSDEVKITGTTINFMDGKYHPVIHSNIRAYYDVDAYDFTHVQSSAFALDREGLDILIRYRLFYPCKQFPDNKFTLIYTSEIAMSVLFRHEKKSLFSYRIGQGLVKFDQTRNEGNLWHIPKTIHPLCETIFVKTNTKLFTFPEKSRYDEN